MTEHLSEKQVARVEALKAASSIGRTSNGPFGTSTPPDVPELVDLADYILLGVHPLDRHLEMP